VVAPALQPPDPARRRRTALRHEPDSTAVALSIGIGSWIVFVIDLVVQRRIVPEYLRTLSGRIDAAIVVLTFPYYSSRAPRATRRSCPQSFDKRLSRLIEQVGGEIA